MSSGDRPKTTLPQGPAAGERMRPVTMPVAQKTPAVRRQQLGRDLINHLFVLLKNAYLHDHGNDALVPPLQKIQVTTGELFELTSNDVLSLRLVSGTFFVNNSLVRLDQGSFANAEFLRIICADLDIGEYEFHLGLSEADLRAMMAVVIDAARTPGSQLRRDFEHLHLKPQVGVSDDDDIVDPKEAALRAYVTALVEMARIIERWIAGRRPSMSNVKRIVQRLFDTVEQDPVILLGLLQLSDYQRHIASHLVNVGILVLIMGRRIGLERDALVHLTMAAVMHEVGAIDLPPALRDGAGGLDARAVQTLERLPHQTTHRLCQFGGRGRQATPRLVTVFENRGHIAGGNLYQFRAAIGAAAQLIAVADAYAHLTAARLGTPAVRADTALEVLAQNPDGRFAPWAVRLLGDCIGQFPVGTLVELDTGERAVVFDRPAPGAAASRPKVRLLRPGQAGIVAGGEVVDLAQTDQTGRYPRSIRRTLKAQAEAINVPHFFLD